jgi:hypothetical protein
MALAPDAAANGSASARIAIAVPCLKFFISRTPGVNRERKHHLDKTREKRRCSRFETSVILDRIQALLGRFHEQKSM